MNNYGWWLPFTNVFLGRPHVEFRCASLSRGYLLQLTPTGRRVRTHADSGSHAVRNLGRGLRRRYSQEKMCVVLCRKI